MTREEYLKLKPGNLVFGSHDSVFGLISQPFDGEVCIMEARNSLAPFDELTDITPFPGDCESKETGEAELTRVSARSSQEVKLR